MDAMFLLVLIAFGAASVALIALCAWLCGPVRPVSVADRPQPDATTGGDR
ncbi:hypothetical protein [Cupriavidus taiwanensis]|uniref:Uncharacterized protein n=1 Tax=Cupriavidus taiwanensis TaxID=164546 RepID=A0A375IYQ1_9BURK|nr:hypothetical protein [Cupriavidus taiwanensis]SPR97542.1 exported hypothetical protein [Cupriavidus taiwanensis]